jgi:hypothetical protein
MAGIVTLDNNNAVRAPTLGLSGALDEIGKAISDENPRLARWLIDVSQRVSGFLDFDLRGLDPDDRAAFWLGVDRANEKFRDSKQQVAFCTAVDVIRLFHEKRFIRGEADGKPISPIDLNEIWFDDNAP